MSIRDIAEQRDIRVLLHFTRRENLNSILTHGLLPISECNRRNIQLITNDELRLDYVPEAICVSIGFPNYKLFYKFRTNTPESDWVVIALKPSILWEKKCIFCSSNAASSGVSGLTIEERSGAQALEKMFNEIDGKPTRQQLNLPNHYPTNPQAEVLVCDFIESSYIIAVCFETEADLNQYEGNNSSGVELLVKEHLFKWRRDYNYW